MLISYSRPAITWAIAGTGASFITDSSALTNGRPADATRIQWLSGAQTTASTVTLTGTLATPISARLAGFLLPNIPTAIPDGVKVTVSGKLSGGAVALNGNSTSTRTALLPNGAAASWWVFPAATIDTIIVTIYNDRNGSTWATAGQYVDLGEIWVGKGADFQIANDLQVDNQGGLLQRQSHNNQAWPLAVQPFRVATVNLSPMTETVAIGPNAAQDDFQTVLNAISTAQSAVIVPAYLSRAYGPSQNGTPPPTITTATINQQRLTRTAMLGVVNQPIKFQGNGDQYFTSPIVFGESPP